MSRLLIPRPRDSRIMSMGLGMGVRLMLEEALGWRGLLCCGWGCRMLGWGVCFLGIRGGWLLSRVVVVVRKCAPELERSGRCSVIAIMKGIGMSKI